jgi:LmbE family N-acetylglucosaminyl deacetylase
VVLSPHIDDAVFSLGAGIHAAVRNGTTVTVLTVLGDDPESSVPAGPWDRRSGFRTEGEAAAARREEDRRACALVGATPEWLPFGDEQYGRRAANDAIWSAVEPYLDGADAVLVPGFPLKHPDHEWLTGMALRRMNAGARVGLYLEQPYVVIRPWWGVWRRTIPPGSAPVLAHLLDGDPNWVSLPAGTEDRAAKLEACRAYPSQLRNLSRFPFLRRMARYESARGGELIAWVRRTKNLS